MARVIPCLIIIGIAVLMSRNSFVFLVGQLQAGNSQIRLQMSAQHRHPRVGAWSSIVSPSLTDMCQVVSSEPRKYQDGTLHAREKQVL